MFLAEDDDDDELDFEVLQQYADAYPKAKPCYFKILRWLPCPRFSDWRFKINSPQKTRAYPSDTFDDFYDE